MTEKLKYYSHYRNLGTWLFDIDYTPIIEEADIVILPGGSDVNPKHYDQPVGIHTYFSDEADARDMALATSAYDNEKFIIGICRGAQLSCVLAGSALIQHVEGHGGKPHSIVDVATGEVIHGVNSLHHQMMYPYLLSKNEYELVAFSTGVGKLYLGGDNKPVISEEMQSSFLEPEIVYYKSINALAFQMHPEMEHKTQLLTYYNNLVRKYYNKFKENKKCKIVKLDY